MANVTVKVQKSEVRLDKRNRPFVNTQDVETGQFFTGYVRKDLTLDLNKLVGKTAVVRGTMHHIGDSPKVIITAIDIVK